MAITSCCNCQKRHVGCHSDCQDYITQLKEYHSAKSVRREEQEKAAGAEIVRARYRAAIRKRREKKW